LHASGPVVSERSARAAGGAVATNRMTMSGTAVLILAHENPGHVRRLIGALGGLDLFMHVDDKTDDDVVREMMADGPDVVLTPRHRSSRKRWSAVEAELDGLRTVLDRSAAEHIVVASGSCYPLVSVGELEDELAQWRGRSRLELNPIPYDGWSQFSALHDGGRHRFDLTFAKVHGELVLIRGMPIPMRRRPVPASLFLQASSQWKVYARAHAQALLAVLDERPDLVRYWSTTFVPEESCVASILCSPALVGDLADELHHDRPWYIDWRGSEKNSGRPRWLGVEDFARLRDARLRPPLRPDDPRERGDAARKLFARKLGEDSDQLVERIDAELRV
jgi:hypothetical protein